ncbi:unnamed protein product [Leptosia nina]|uniref:Uncharacterized protein n=1 Tax=Leptosia nina TaxID=320188 RepID=A0AAV1JYN8_9NEOP
MVAKPVPPKRPPHPPQHYTGLIKDPNVRVPSVLPPINKNPSAFESEFHKFMTSSQSEAVSLSNKKNSQRESKPQNVPVNQEYPPKTVPAPIGQYNDNIFLEAPLDYRTYQTQRLPGTPSQNYNPPPERSPWQSDYYIHNMQNNPYEQMTTHPYYRSPYQTPWYGYQK